MHRRTRVTILTVAFFATGITRGIAAHQHENCRGIANNSCWKVHNDTSDRISLLCTGDDGATFTIADLQPGLTWSYQFCNGMSDGLGFTAGKVECVFNKTNIAELRFSFEAPGPGDRVQFTAGKKSLAVKIIPYWSKGHTQRQFGYR